MYSVNWIYGKENNFKMAVCPISNLYKIRYHTFSKQRNRIVHNHKSFSLFLDCLTSICDKDNEYFFSNSETEINEQKTSCPIWPYDLKLVKHKLILRGEWKGAKIIPSLYLLKIIDKSYRSPTLKFLLLKKWHFWRKF